MKPALIVMAAGMGSRYGGGGLKQIEAVGPSGELLIDYSVYDALRAGFGRIVFVIKNEFRLAFREAIGKRIEAVADVAYVFQDTADIPKGIELPMLRTKPWGTAHAVLAARDAVTEPFAVITADDFQGPTSFRMIADFLEEADEKVNDKDGLYKYAMVGFELGQTLSKAGSVARGVCVVKEDGNLKTIVERKNISLRDEGIICEDDLGKEMLSPSNTVSMSAWGFTPSFFEEAEAGFVSFLNQHMHDKEALATKEFYIPSLVNRLVSEGKASVKVFLAQERWCGITNPGDKPIVVENIRRMVEGGLYPPKLW